RDIVAHAADPLELRVDIAAEHLRRELRKRGVIDKCGIDADRQHGLVSHNWAPVVLARQTPPAAMRSTNPAEKGFPAASERLTYANSRRTRIMPLVRIDLIEGKSAEFRKSLG